MHTLTILPLDLLTPEPGPVTIEILKKKGATRGEVIGVFPESQRWLAIAIQSEGLFHIPAESIGIYPQTGGAFELIAISAAGTSMNVMQNFGRTGGAEDLTEPGSHIMQAFLGTSA